MATTTFNAAFFAGLEDVEHKPHSFYIDRYPVGREATVAWPTVDLRFRNDTPYGVLISARLTPSTPSSSGALTVSMYSTKYWDITATTGERYNFTQPETRTLRTEDCYPNDGLRRLRHRRRPPLPPRRREHPRPLRADAHDVHPLGHGDLPTPALTPVESGQMAVESGQMVASATISPDSTRHLPELNG